MTVEVLKSHFEHGRLPHRSSDGLPLALVIDGKPHLITELLGDGGAIVDFDGYAEPAQMLQSTLLVAFDGFEVSVPALWEVVSSVREHEQLFVRLAPVNEADHLATINTLLQAIRSGEMLRAADMLEMARVGAGVDASAEAGEEPVRGGFKRRAGAVLFLLLALLLLGFIASNLLARAYMVTADGTIVTPPTKALRAPEDAQLIAYQAQPGTRVRPGEAVASLRSAAGTAIVINSPCDCVVSEQLASPNTALRQGQPFVRLTPAEGSTRGLLSLPLEDLRSVRIGDKVTARFYDTDARVEGRVERVVPPKVTGDAAARPTRYSGTIEVRFANPVAAWRIGEPISARIALSRLNPFNP